jgi:hypothetical protein
MSHLADRASTLPDEFGFYLADLGVKAVVVEAGSDSPARAAALSRGIEVLELASSPTCAAGLFSLTGSNGRAATATKAGRRRGRRAAAAG